MNDSIDKKLDLRGEVCPYTFVKSKLAIEPMDSGQVLQIILDHKPAIENVSQSMENEGHKTLEISKIRKKEWKMVIEKN